MPREFRLPELAESVVEGEIVQWLVAEGEHVAEDQALVEVMTDKVTVELPSPFAGVLQKQLVAEGDVVPVHTPIALFAQAGDGEGVAGDAPAGEADRGPVAGATHGSDTEAAGEQAERGSHDGSGQDGGARTERSAEPAQAPDPDEGDALSLFKASGDVDEEPVFRVQRPADRARSGGSASGASVSSVAASGSTTSGPVASVPGAGRATGPYGRVLAVPAARRLARELDVELERVEGSGPNGRIRVDDVRAHADGGGRAAGFAAPSGRIGGAPIAPTRYQTPEGYADREERLPMRGVRRAISNQMVASHLQAVRALHVDEADVSELVALRTRLKARAEERGVKLSYLPFVMKAVVSALEAYPMVNASYDEERGEIVRKQYYNLGLAVATDQGLVVPVVRDVDRRGLLSVASEIRRLAEGARTGKLVPEDMRGGTFSITNIGTIGGLFSFPIINVPEAAILGVHSIQKRPVVLEDDSIVARHMLYLSLSFDHRLVDGAEGARFTRHVIDLLEDPEALLLDV